MSRSIGLDRCTEAHEPVNIGPPLDQPDTYGSRNHGTKRATWMIGDWCQWQLESVSDNLLPESAARASVGHAHLAYLDADVGEDVEVVAQAVPRALETGAIQVGTRVRELQPYEGAARLRVVDRAFSPRKYGRQTRPSAPLGTSAASASSWAKLSSPANCC